MWALVLGLSFWNWDVFVLFFIFMYSGTIDLYIFFPIVVNLELSYVTATLNEEIRSDPCF